MLYLEFDYIYFRSYFFTPTASLSHLDHITYLLYVWNSQIGQQTFLVANILLQFAQGEDQQFLVFYSNTIVQTGRPFSCDCLCSILWIFLNNGIKMLDINLIKMFDPALQTFVLAKAFPDGRTLLMTLFWPYAVLSTVAVNKVSKIIWH